MKSLLAVICLLTGATLLPAETTPPKSVITIKPDGPATTATPTPPAAPVKATVKAKPEAKKVVEEPKIPGVTIARANGTFLGLEVVGANFKLSFYDAKKKPAAVDVTRATARWPNPRSVTGPNRAVLNPSGNALVGNKPVLPPLNFTVNITLLQGEGEEGKVVENFNVPFHS